MIASVDPVTTSVGQVSPAKYRLQAGDIILTVNEKPVDTNDGLQEQVAASEGRPNFVTGSAEPTSRRPGSTAGCSEISAGSAWTEIGLT